MWGMHSVACGHMLACMSPRIVHHYMLQLNIITLQTQCTLYKPNTIVSIRKTILILDLSIRKTILILDLLMWLSYFQDPVLTFENYIKFFLVGIL